MTTTTSSEKQSRRSRKWLWFTLIFAMLLIGGAVFVRLVVFPKQEADLIAKTSDLGNTKRNCQMDVSYWDDGYSGYAYLRSGVFHNDLERTAGVCFDHTSDDNVLRRVKALASGDADIAAITIGDLIKYSVEIEQFPATMIAVISVSNGSDGMVGPALAFPTLASLDDPELHIVAVENTPSVMFAKAFHTDMNLMQAPSDWLRGEKTPEALLKRLKAMPPTEKTAYVFYEPYLSMALAVDGMTRILDTSQLSGVIVDVLVVRRGFLAEHPEVVSQILQSYQRTVYSYTQKGDGAIAQLLVEDAGGELSLERAKQTADGILWQNLSDNYARYGLLGNQRPANVPLLIDTIENITRILVQTGEIEGVPYDDPVVLTYTGVLSDLQTSGFHPRASMGLIQGADIGDVPVVQTAADLPSLSEGEWDALVPVPHLRVPVIQFMSGSSKLTPQGKSQVNQIVRQLNSYPEFYITVEGRVRAGSNPELDLQLATERGEVVEQALVDRGISAKRVRSVGIPPTSSSGASQSVSFKLGQRPF